MKSNLVQNQIIVVVSCLMASLTVRESGIGMNFNTNKKYELSLRYNVYSILRSVNERIPKI
jgi:hypothetical protein